jgi:hypothetical protein
VCDSQRSDGTNAFEAAAKVSKSNACVCVCVHINARVLVGSGCALFDHITARTRCQITVRVCTRVCVDDCLTVVLFVAVTQSPSLHAYAIAAADVARGACWRLTDSHAGQGIASDVAVGVR